MHWIQLTQHRRLKDEGVRKTVILCNLALVTQIEDMSHLDRGTLVQYDEENYLYVEETPEEIFALQPKQFK